MTAPLTYRRPLQGAHHRSALDLSGRRALCWLGLAFFAVSLGLPAVRFFPSDPSSAPFAVRGWIFPASPFALTGSALPFYTRALASGLFVLNILALLSFFVFVIRRATEGYWALKALGTALLLTVPPVFALLRWTPQIGTVLWVMGLALMILPPAAPPRISLGSAGARRQRSFLAWGLGLIFAGSLALWWRYRHFQPPQIARAALVPITASVAVPFLLPVVSSNTLNP